MEETMQRYFVDRRDANNLYLEPGDIIHTQRVMRYTNGDEVIGIDSTGNNYVCKIKDITKGILQMQHRIDNDTSLDVAVTLIYALPKGDKFKWVLQKATELGVHEIVPLQTERCVTKLSTKDFSKKKLRYQKIIKEASEQSLRNDIPILRDLITVDQMPNFKRGRMLIAYEQSASQGEHTKFAEVLQTMQSSDAITIVVGSEGGFAPEEIEMMLSFKGECCSLGKRILRSETAPLYMLSVIGYSRELGDKNGIIQGTK